MTDNRKNPDNEEKDIESYRKAKKDKIARLSDYKSGYDVDKFILDLELYFNNEVDFNLKKIRQTLEAPGKLDQLIEKAKSKETHPVTEFIQELFKDLGSSGDIPWEP